MGVTKCIPVSASAKRSWPRMHLLVRSIPPDEPGGSPPQEQRGVTRGAGRHNCLDLGSAGVHRSGRAPAHVAHSLIRCVRGMALPRCVLETYCVRVGGIRYGATAAHLSSDASYERSFQKGVRAMARAR